MEIKTNSIKTNQKEKEKENDEDKDKDKEKDKDKNKDIFTLSRKKRWVIFYLLLSFYMIMNMDQGTLSGSTNNIKTFYNMEDKELGLFGSMVFLGITIGCVTSTIIINKFSRKKVLIILSILNTICLFFITQIKYKIILYLCRFISGFCQSFISIYLPVWSDQFGIHKKKSFKMTLIHLTSTMGYLFGYIFGILINWINTFYFQVSFLIFQIIFLVLFIDIKFFSTTIIPLKKKQIAKIELIDNSKNEISKKEKEKEKEIDEISLFEDIKQNNKKTNFINESVFDQIMKCLKSKLFISTNISLFSMFIIISGIQFWINDYMENSLNIEDKNERLTIFIILIVSSPVFGISVGGILATKIGGYDNKNSIYVPFFSSMIVCLCSNFIVLTSNKTIFLILFWIYLFCGSIVLPVLNGIILCSVDKKYAGIASSLSTFFYNIFGRFPGPNIYGFIKDKTFETNKKFAMCILLNFAFISFFSLFVSIKFSNELYNQEIKTMEFELDISSSNIKNNEI